MVGNTPTDDTELVLHAEDKQTQKQYNIPVCFREKEVQTKQYESSPVIGEKIPFKNQTGKLGRFVQCEYYQSVINIDAISCL